MRKIKMNLYVIALLFLLFPTYVVGQESAVQLTWGDEIKVRKGTYLNSSIGSDNAASYFVLHEGWNWNVLKFDRSMKEQLRARIDLDYKKKPREFEFVSQFGENLYLFTSFFNDKHQKKYLFFETLGKDELSFRGDLQYVGGIPQKSTFKEGFFEQVKSPDEKKLAVYYQLPFKKKQTERFGVRVYGEGMQTLWKKDIELPVRDGDFSVQDYQLDNAGNFFIYGIYYPPKEDTTSRSQHQIIAYFDQGRKQKILRIEPGEKKIADITFRLRGNQVIVAGFYSDYISLLYGGSFFLAMDKVSGEILQSSFKPFEKEFLVDDFSKKEKRKANRREKRDKPVIYELGSYYMDKLLLQEDGSVVLVAEKYYTRTSTSTYVVNGETKYRTRTYYHYDDIIVVKVNPVGEIDWQTRIKKKQQSIDDGGYYSSYVLAQTGKQLQFVFNDSQRNHMTEEKEHTYRTNTKFGKCVRLVSINQQGEQSRSVLMKDDAIDVRITPIFSDQISKDELLLYGSYRKKNQFIKVKFVTTP